MTKHPLGEFALIDRLKETLGAPNARVKLGPGDDAAITVCEPGRDLLLASDAMVEGVHFDFAYMTAADLGHKAVAAAMSDIAAMNGRPLYALISLALPRERAEDFLEGFYDSAAQLARWWRFDIVGGDLTRSKAGAFIDVAAIGDAVNPVRRSGAKPGDWLAVSGTPGGSAAGLQALTQGLPGYSALKQKHLRPEPRFDLLSNINSKDLFTSLIDISDGLASEAHHLARASRVGFEIDAGKLPLHPEALELDAVRALEWCLSGGEDYELLATLDPTAVESMGGPPPGFRLIGRATSTPSKVVLLEADQERLLAPSGFNHFV